MSQSIGEGTQLAPATRASTSRRWIGIGLGVLAVAISAQIAVPLPFTAVPFTLQPLAVLIVGGLLGARGGAAALALYIALGLMGLPVFAMGGSGLARLLGPTGGYLLAFPLAAAVTGYVAQLGRGRQDGRDGQVGRRVLAPSRLLTTLGGCALGIFVIHFGGTAHLAVLTGDPGLAFRTGFVPFLTGDLLKIGLAAVVLLLAGPRLRSLS